MAGGLFVTGTDTGCGKTEVTLGMMDNLQQQGETVLGMKPIASGAVVTDEGLR
ncbi:MAG: dethiobiotin synthase, partial [Candidatus Thiodiazotropha sp.]